MSGELNFLDVLFILILFFSFFFGLFRGLTRELLSLLFLVAALALAFVYYPQAGRMLDGLVRSRELADLAGFLLVLALAAAAGSLVTHLVSTFLVVGPLKAADRLLGAVFGTVRGILLCGLLIYGFLAFPLNQDLLNRSRLAPDLTRVIVAGIRVLPPSLRDRLKLIEIHERKKDSRDSRTV
ncbi:MAG: CvpA family protein [Candidatus Aminicenantes bacterium]|nr:CvpA family protein [Candidatus Aminicenantes bacterium]